MVLESIHEQLTEILRTRVLALFGHAVDRVVLQTPPKLSLGDLATPLPLELAKALRRKPRDIAQEIANGMELPDSVLIARTSKTRGARPGADTTKKAFS